jgi:hypothetical protein
VLLQWASCLVQQSGYQDCVWQCCSSEAPVPILQCFPFAANTQSCAVSGDLTQQVVELSTDYYQANDGLLTLLNHIRFLINNFGDTSLQSLLDETARCTTSLAMTILPIFPVFHEFLRLWEFHFYSQSSRPRGRPPLPCEIVGSISVQHTVQYSQHSLSLSLSTVFSMLSPVTAAREPRSGSGAVRQCILTETSKQTNKQPSKQTNKQLMNV